MNCVEISSIFCQILGPLVLGWAPNHLILGTQLAPGEKMLVCIPDLCAEHSNTPDVCIGGNGKMCGDNFPNTQRPVKHKKYLTEQSDQ